MTEDHEIRWDPRGNQPRWLRALPWVLIVLVPVQLALAVVEGARPIAYVLFVMVGLSLALSWLSQRSIVVDAGGVRLPLRRKILWRDVERVSEPGRFDPVVTVVLQDGRTRPTGLPPEYAAEVAKIGHVPFGSV